MKKIKPIAIFYLLATLLTMAADRIIPESGKFESRFLVVIDSRSFEEATEEVMAYKAVLEEEGLGVVIMISNWDNPLKLREEITDPPPETGDGGGRLCWRHPRSASA